MAGRAHIAGLDGLRGLALVVVMGYHLAPGAVPGGFITLTLFFSLSGYLITTLVLEDLDTGTFTLRRFYVRRIRRLLPAALLVLAAVALVWSLAGWMDTTVRADIGFAAGQIFNWREVARGQVYGTESVSPVMHYWSLAVEEQIYLVLPVLLVLGRRRPGWALGVALGVPVVATVLSAGEQTVLYYGTHVRGGEVLAGALAAVVVRRHGSLPRQVATAVSAVSLGAVMMVAVTVEVSEPVLYSGGLLAGGVLTAFVVATVPMGAVAAVVDNAVLVWIGRLSYVLYLAHWPAMVALRRLEWEPWQVALGTVAISVPVAAIVHRWYEAPMRSRWAPRRFGLALATVAVIAGASTAGASRSPVSFEEAAKELERRAAQLTSSGTGPTMALFGDSKMLTLGMGMGPVDGFDLVYMHGILRCPLGRGGEILINDAPYSVPDECDWDKIPPRTARVALVWYGTWDARGRVVPEVSPGWVGIDDARYQTWLAAEYEAFFDVLRTRIGAEAIVVMNLHPNGVGEFERFNAFLEDLARTHPDVVVLDFARWVATQDVDAYLPDGVHLSWGQPTAYSPGTDNSALRLMKVWLAPELCAVVAGLLGDGAAGAGCATLGRGDGSSGP